MLTFIDGSPLKVGTLSQGFTAVIFFLLPVWVRNFKLSGVLLDSVVEKMCLPHSSHPLPYSLQF